MKFLLTLLATLFLALPAWAVDVQMGYDGNLVFEPNEITINAGDSVHFVNNMLPPHNVVVEDHDELSHEALAMMPGEEFDITFSEVGDYTFWCGPHKGAGMIGTIHVPCTLVVCHSFLTIDDPRAFYALKHKPSSHASPQNFITIVAPHQLFWHIHKV